MARPFLRPNLVVKLPFLARVVNLMALGSTPLTVICEFDQSILLLQVVAAKYLMAGFRAIEYLLPNFDQITL